MTRDGRPAIDFRQEPQSASHSTLWKGGQLPARRTLGMQAKVAPSPQSCPLNHRQKPQGYPQMWKQFQPQLHNRQLAGPTVESGRELQPCKLPTLWITPVENFRSPRVGTMCPEGWGEAIQAQRMPQGRARSAHDWTQLLPHGKAGTQHGRARGATLGGAPRRARRTRGPATARRGRSWGVGGVRDIPPQ
jgi:hypothetical protein